MTPTALPLVLTCGDPAGCGPDITAKAWRAFQHQPEFAFFVIGSRGLYPDVPVETVSTPEDARDVFSRALPVFELPMPAIRPGHPDPAAAPATIEAIRIATDWARARRVSAVVTNPINKAQLYSAGFKHAGHTEYLADLCAVGGIAPQPVMMLIGGGLRVALATIHVPLMQVSRALTPEHLMRVARITHDALRRDFGLSEPRLAFSGLNPHAGESGTIGREEIDIINPAAESLRREGIRISDARSGDTVFAEMRRGDFDGVIAMTHDQGLIPVKTLDLWGGVNVTLGLPIIRTSPDHGTAYDAAARGDCTPESLITAIRTAREMASHRVRVSA